MGHPLRVKLTVARASVAPNRFAWAQQHLNSGTQDARLRWAACFNGVQDRGRLRS